MDIMFDCQGHSKYKKIYIFFIYILFFFKNTLHPEFEYQNKTKNLFQSIKETGSDISR